MRIRGYVALTLVLIAPFSTQPVHAEERKTVASTGTVLDENNEPISTVSIRVLGSGNAPVPSTTDSSGESCAVSDREGWCSVYAMCNRSDTPGVDYVPSLRRSYLQMIPQPTFTREKGALLCVDEELWFVEGSEPVDLPVNLLPNRQVFSFDIALYFLSILRTINSAGSVWIDVFSQPSPILA